MKQARTRSAGKNAASQHTPARSRAFAAASLAPPPYGIAQVDAAAGVSGPGGALPHAARIQAAFGPAHDVSSIRAHVGGAAAVAAARLGAEAYATGNRIAFARPPSLHTAAHEAAHVVQQRAGVQLLGGVGEADDTYERNADAVADRVVAGRSAADLLPASGGRTGARVVQMRRLPSSNEIKTMLADPAGANYQAHLAGAIRLIDLAMVELTPDEVGNVKRFIQQLEDTEQAEDKNSAQMKLMRMVAAIRVARPDLVFGDPRSIYSPPPPANLKALVEGAERVFAEIATGNLDDDIEQVFGAPNRTVARAKYQAAREWMHKLHERNKIFAERGGYSEEIGLGAVTVYQTSIRLSPARIDNPEDTTSIITMIHESMHAGNKDVGDKGYIGTPVFSQLSEEVKLTNAAHFEVVPRRFLEAGHAYAGKVFTPAGTGSASPLTPLQSAVRAASEQIRKAWSMGNNLHEEYLTAYKEPKEWSKSRAGGSFRVGLPYWSRVQRLTIHQKQFKDPAAKDLRRRPITEIDLALSEGVTRRIRHCMVAIGKVPNDPEGAMALLGKHAETEEIAAAEGDATAYRDLWIRVALRIANGIMVGANLSEDRDLRLVQVMARGRDDFSNHLRKQDPSSFPP